MHSRILLISAAVVGMACGATGPASRSGLTACDQLKECLCTPERTNDVDTCNLNVDNISMLQNGLQICQAQLTACGPAIIVTQPSL